MSCNLYLRASDDVVERVFGFSADARKRHACLVEAMRPFETTNSFDADYMRYERYQRALNGDYDLARFAAYGDAMLGKVGVMGPHRTPVLLPFCDDVHFGNFATGQTKRLDPCIQAITYLRDRQGLPADIAARAIDALRSGAAKGLYWG